MKSFADALEAAEKVSTKKEKFAALSGIVKDQQRLIFEALNPYRVFNVKKFDLPDKFASKDPASMENIYLVLDALHDRKITGDAARSAVTGLLSFHTERTAKYLTRVLRKDLDCGAARNTFTKIYPSLKIPQFKVALAKKMTPKYKWQFPCIAEAKYDGQRVLAFVDLHKYIVTYLGRSGRPMTFCNGLFDEDLLKLRLPNSSMYFVVDGEVKAKSFQESMTAKGSKNDKAKKNLRFHAFDWMATCDWTTRRNLEKQVYRSETLYDAITLREMKTVIPAKHRVVHSISEAHEFYRGVLKDKDEGLIIKDPKAYYSWSRSPAWVKWKPIMTLDLTVVEVIRGKKKYSNTCGAVSLKGKDENGLKIKTKMGTGLSDKLRDWIWRNRKKIVGWTMEIEGQELTKAKNSDTYSVRFPVFKKWRNDK